MALSLIKYTFSSRVGEGLMFESHKYMCRTTSPHLHTGMCKLSDLNNPSQVTLLKNLEISVSSYLMQHQYLVHMDIFDFN